jgi:hypothetical protein
MFRKATPANSTSRSCLEIAGSDGIRSGVPMFFLTIWFQRESCEALLTVSSMRRDFSFHGEVS